FYSTGYLDISVPQVPPPAVNCRVPCISAWGVAPFGHRRITAVSQLPDDFRGVCVLLRPNKPRHPPCALIHIRNLKFILLMLTTLYVFSVHHDSFFSSL